MLLAVMWLQVRLVEKGRWPARRWPWATAVSPPAPLASGGWVPLVRLLLLHCLVLCLLLRRWPQHILVPLLILFV